MGGRGRLERWIRVEWWEFGNFIGRLYFFLKVMGKVRWRKFLVGEEDGDKNVSCSWRSDVVFGCRRRGVRGVVRDEIEKVYRVLFGCVLNVKLI